MLSVGQLLDARYRIERHLAEGGMAHVYIAVDTKTDARVAVKVMKKHLFARPEMRARFIAEAKTAAKVQSKHVVRVLDVDEDEDAGVAYLVMELLAGDTLAARIERGAMPREEAIRVLGQVARALDAAHRAGLVHRDLKPGNVLLAEDEDGVTAKVLDFGIARSMDSAHATATEIGTPAYAAPEQLAKSFRARARKAGVAVADEVSPATDVWALGLIAYECLTGAPPMQVWGVESSTELPVRILEEVPVPSEVAGAAARRLPVGFDAWFARCVEREAAKRFQGAGEAVAALAGLGAGASAGVQGEGDRARAAGTSVGVATFAPGMAESGAARATTAGRGTGTEVGSATFAPEAKPAETGPAAAPKSGVRAGAIAIGAVALVALVGVGVAVARGGSSGAPGEAAAASTNTAAATASTTTATATASASSASPTPAALTAAASAPGSPCPEGMVLLEGGTFTMGSTEADDEKPPHKETVASFCLDRTEVTASAYAACVSSGKCTAAGTGESATLGVAGKEQHPIIDVDWTQATKYCEAMGRRLPTEVEWEYAARGGKEAESKPRKFPWGDAAPTNRACWNGEGNDLGKGNRKGTCAVGSYPAGDSAQGVHDLAGSVYEWTSSPRCPYSSTGTTQCNEGGLVLRGGSWGNDGARMLGASSRLGAMPSYRGSSTGFRCARSAVGAPATATSAVPANEPTRAAPTAATAKPASAPPPDAPRAQPARATPKPASAPAPVVSPKQLGATPYE
jgi:formylglycine-generating enzyme required for sulfatase activity/tRNA A-37 threonylcarbamoyl transferase component Bud32